MIKERTKTTESINAVREYAISPFKEIRVVDGIKEGEFVRQGDVYLVCIDKAAGWKATKNRQLAPGTTQGSRHTVDASVMVLANPNGAQIVRVARNRARCFGPQVVSKDRFTVSHPEHADISLPAGTYQVMFQVDPQSMQRVRD